MRTILVASDLTATSDVATRTALALSRASGAALHVVHVARDEDDLLETSARHQEYLSTLTEALGRVGAEQGEYRMHIATGDTPSSIGEVADKIDAGVVILGRRADPVSTAHRPIGGTAYAVITRSRAPCLAVTEPLKLPLRKALVAIDRSETARGALLVALSWVSAIRPRDLGEEYPTLTALHVHPGTNDPRAAAPVDERTIEHELDILRRNAGAWAGVSVLEETVDGEDPAKIIASFARERRCELVVLGTRGISDPEAGLGSIAASVTSELSIPVLLVPPAVWRDHAKDIDYF